MTYDYLVVEAEVYVRLVAEAEVVELCPCTCTYRSESHGDRSRLVLYVRLRHSSTRLQGFGTTIGGRL